MLSRRNLHFWGDFNLIEKIDKDIYIKALDYSIKARRDNLRWLMCSVTIDRTDEWRDRQFHKLEADLDSLVAERELAIAEIGDEDA